MERLTRILAILAVLTPCEAKAQLNILGGLAHDLPMVAGASVDREIEIENLGDERTTARIYQTDYSLAADGTNSFGAPGTEWRSNASWITFEPSVIIIEPGESRKVRFRVTVPTVLPDGLTAGSFWSILMIEGALRDELSSAPAENQVGLRRITRFGVEIASHVGEGTPAIEFANGSLEATEAGPVLRIDLVNTGDLMLHPDLTLRVVDADGKEVGPFTSIPKRIYPGTSVRHVIALSGAPPGAYSAILIADGGDNNVFGASLNLTL